MSSGDRQPTSSNDWADFWRQNIGVNVIPCDTKSKRPIVEWQYWQDKPIPDSLHNQWKEKGMFKKGMGVIPGKVWHRPEKVGLYLCAIDIDNRKGIEELCTRNGKTVTLERFAEGTIVEQHKDDLGKAHVYVYSRHPYTKKSSDNVSGEVAAKIKANDVPAFEVKGLGEHGIMFCSPSIHKDGHPYEIIGVLEPALTDELEQHIDDICRKYDLAYLSVSRDDRALQPIAELFREGTLIHQGHNRHEALLRVSESLLVRNRAIMTTDEIRELAEKWNANHCLPPLPPDEFEKQWNDALKFVERKHAGRSEKGEEEEVSGQDQSRRISKGEALYEFFKEHCDESFVDEFQQPYAVIDLKDHKEVLSMSSSRFKQRIAKLFYDETRLVLTESDISNFLNLAKANALFSGNEKKLGLRVATVLHEGSDKPKAIYYDLVNSKWTCVKITAAGWSVEPCPIMFRRYNSNKAQVEPAREHPPDILDQFLRLTNARKDDWILVKCYILSLFMQEMAKPGLMPHGEKGSGKSTMQHLVKDLVDPSSVDFLSIPHDRNQLIQNLAHNYLAYYDNVSYIPAWLSDEFCKAVTGAGLSKRMLYTDDEDIVYSFRRALGFNGINLAATRSDLLDRGLSIHLEGIKGKARKSEKQIWTDFDRIRPSLLGYIMGILVKVLQEWDSVKLEELPRMADFARFGELAARCMGYEANTFIDAYRRNISAHNREAIATSPVAMAIQELIKRERNFEGTASELLTLLDPIAIEQRLNSKEAGWPSSPQSLGRRLNEIKADLREVGIIVERPEDKAANIVKVLIRKSDNLAVSAERPSHVVGNSENNHPEASSQREIPCPYCTARFPIVDDALRHSVNIHPRRPFAQDLAKLGFDFRFD